MPPPLAHSKPAPSNMALSPRAREAADTAPGAAEMGMCLLRAHCSVPSPPQEEDPVPERSQEHLPAHHPLGDEGGNSSPASGEGLMGHRGCSCTCCGGTCVPAGPILTPVTHSFCGHPCLLLLDAQPSSLLFSFIPSFLLQFLLFPLPAGGDLPASDGI